MNTPGVEVVLVGRITPVLLGDLLDEVVIVHDLRNSHRALVEELGCRGVFDDTVRVLGVVAALDQPLAWAPGNGREASRKLHCLHRGEVVGLVEGGAFAVDPLTLGVVDDDEGAYGSHTDLLVLCLQSCDLLEVVPSQADGEAGHELGLTVLVCLPCAFADDEVVAIGGDRVLVYPLGLKTLLHFLVVGWQARK